MPLDFSRRPKGFNGVQGAREYERVAAALLVKGESVCRHLLPSGRKEGNEWRVGSLNGEQGRSMGVNLRTGKWADFAGKDGGGDLLYLWSDVHGISVHEALVEAEQWLGWDTGKAKVDTTWPRPIVVPAMTAPISREDDKDKWWLRIDPKKWEYFDAKGELWATVRRWDNPDLNHPERKRVRPWDHKREDEKWPEGARPLYKLDEISQSTGPVILVEGEKCADALRTLGHVATTMPGGASAARVIDWSPLHGRDVVRWADNDEAGAKWAETTLAALMASGVRSIRDVTTPSGKPDGWDCADATDAEIGALLAATGAPAPTARPITAKAFKPPAFQDIPKRRFVYDHIYQCGTLTVTAGEGGAGKSALHVIEAIAIATGRDLLQTGKPIERCRVWLIALEDDEDEMNRRIAAAMIHFNVEWPDLDGWLFVTTQSHAPDFLVATSTREGVEVSRKDIDALKAEITERGIGVTIFDPYVYLHTINENDNSGQAAVMKALVSVFLETKTAGALVHHAKKPSANDRSGPSAADIRGASAIVNSSRHGRLVNTMTAADAEKLGVPDGERHFYFRTTSVKANYSPKAHAGRWFKMHGVRLPNGDNGEEGDGVGVVTKWTPPDEFSQLGVTVETLRAVQAEVERAYQAGTPYRVSPKADPWIGEVIGNAVGLELKDKDDKAKIAKILATWIRTGALVEDRTWSDGHQKRPIIRSGSRA